MTRFDLQRVINILHNTHGLKAKIYNHPIISTDKYEYGWQESLKCPDGKLYYIVFYDLLMVDLDINIDTPTILNSIASILLEFNVSGRLYKTYNGYHLFITSKPINHKSTEAEYLMKILQCDMFYIRFSYFNGFKVRLNPKNRDDECIAAEYISTIGNVSEDPSLIELLEIHDIYLHKHIKKKIINCINGKQTTTTDHSDTQSTY